MIETKEIMGREAVTGGIFECRYDESLTLTQADNSLFRLLGMNAGSLKSGTPISFLDRICAEDRPIFLEKIRYQLSRSRVFMSELHIMTSNGQLRWIHICGELLTEQESPLLHCIFHDVTDARDRQERLAIESQIYDIILSQTQDIIFELDCLTRDIYYSPTFEKKFGYQIPVRGFPDSMFATDIIHEKDKIPLRSCFQSILAGQDQMQCEYRLKHRNGRYLWVSVNATAIRDLRGRLLKIVGIISDINEQKEEILRAKKDALLDPLTSLLNRRECIRRIEAYTMTDEEMGALILIDIDNFKSINDTNGHLFGDKVLVDLAAALRLAFRRNDITARIGGDEFIAFMPHIHVHEDVVPKLETILYSLSRCAKTGGKEETAPEPDDAVTFSIGVSFYPDHGKDFSSLFEKADAAMYHAKRRGKNQYYIYKEDGPQAYDS